MELIPVKALVKALQEQGFEVVIDEDSRGNRWIDVYQGDRYLAPFSLDPRDHRARRFAIAVYRRHGFVW